MKYLGTLDALKEKLRLFHDAGQWKVLNTNQYQFHHETGAILNWFPSTGTINFQGKENSQFYEQIKSLLDGEVINTNKIETDSSNAIEEIQENFLTSSYTDSELVIGLVGAVGTDLDHVIKIINERLNAFEYSSEHIKISTDVINALKPKPINGNNFERIDSLMTRGNQLRSESGNNAILALSVAAKINEFRESLSSTTELEPIKRKAFIISSLKHPAEVQELRRIYSNGFILIGVYADENRRFDFLTKTKNISSENAKYLMKRDLDEESIYGQHTRDTYHLSDFFVNFDGSNDKLENDVWRFLDLIFGHPYITPTFDEFAMFMALPHL